MLDITAFMSSKSLIIAEHWFKFGMPGVSITRKPILNYSTVIISSVVPGASDSVSTSYFYLYINLPFFGAVGFFFMYFFDLKRSEFKKLDLPEFVAPRT